MVSLAFPFYSEGAMNLPQRVFAGGSARAPGEIQNVEFGATNIE
jgi:hypothetical protein